MTPESIWDLLSRLWGRAWVWNWTESVRVKTPNSRKEKILQRLLWTILANFLDQMISWFGLPSFSHFFPDDAILFPMHQKFYVTWIIPKIFLARWKNWSKMGNHFNGLKKTYKFQQRKLNNNINLPILVSKRRSWRPYLVPADLMSM